MLRNCTSLGASLLCCLLMIAPPINARENELVARYQRKTPKTPAVNTSSTTISGVEIAVSRSSGTLEATVEPLGPVPKDVEEKWNKCRQILARIAERSVSLSLNGKSSEKALFNDSANMAALQDFLDEGCQDLLGEDSGFDTSKEIARQVADQL